MKKFIFRLETLLKLRKLKESHLQKELAHTQLKSTQIQEKKSTLQRQIDALIQEMQKQRAEQQFSFQETYTQILDHLTASLESMQHTHAALTQQIEVIQHHLKQAVQERKVIEKIREKQYNGWRVKTDSEGDRLDELALKNTAPYK
ncbi:MAG: hypothetical protein S4CHLAM123_07760 [Chlamydiales bacterium]|nr:hypothetical protein [Chlamydiales bacterium]